MELSQLMSDLRQYEGLLIVGSFVVLPFAIVYLGPRLADSILDFLQPYSKTGLKNNTLNIDVGAKKSLIYKIGIVALGLFIVLIFESFANAALLALLVSFAAGIYMELVPTPGIYKNGKYLGTVYTGFIKVGDGLTLGKRQGTETIGSLKILRDGWIVAELNLTAEGFMELSPDKISEVFPEIKGKVKRFKNLYKMGDYTLQYSFFQKTANASYQEVVNTKSSFDDDTSERLRRYTYDPAYSYLPYNVFNHD